jgi:hypothetical protein
MWAPLSRRPQRVPVFATALPRERFGTALQRI